MDIVVTTDNAPQIIQAMHENVKSNQHRIDTMEPTLHKMAGQIDRLDHMLVGNGFAKAVKDNADDLKAFRLEFGQFKLNREESCPVTKRVTDIQSGIQETKSWKATVLRLVFGAIGTVSTSIIIIEKLFS